MHFIPSLFWFLPAGTCRRLSLLVGLWLLAGLAARAQAPAWQSALVIPSVSINATAADASGNLYVVGQLSGPTTLGSTTLVPAGGIGSFVAKWNTATSTWAWAKDLGGRDAYSSALAVSGGSVYIAGVFATPTATFGSITLTNTGNVSLYVAKLTDAGTFVWAIGASTPNGVEATALAASGNTVYVAGNFHGPGLTLGNTALTSFSSTDMYVAKITDAGSTASFGWAQTAGGTSATAQVVASSIVLNGPSVYVAGNFGSSSVPITSATWGSTTLTSAGGYDLFITKLTDAGNSGSFIWAQRAGGVGSESPIGLAVNGSSVYVAGPYDTGAASFGSTTLPLNGSRAAFVAKLTDAGSTASFAWAQAITSTVCYARSLVAAGNSVYVGGSFFNTLVLGTSGIAGPTSVSASDAFLTKLVDAGSTGSFSWVQVVTGIGYEEVSWLALSNSRVYMFGSGYSATSFGAITLTAPNAFGFLASLTDATLATAASSALAGLSIYPNPAHGTATVRLPTVPGAVSATLTLVDALGRVMHVQEVRLAAGGTLAEVPLPGLGAGLYRVRVRVGEHYGTLPLVIE